MKIKMILPVIAILLAFGSALATKPFSQTGWFKNGSGVVTSGNIDNVITDQHPCAENRATICKVGDFNAYVSPEAAANAPALAGLLKYNP
jgi:Family of unknown function (DUF6520)